MGGAGRQTVERAFSVVVTHPIYTGILHSVLGEGSAAGRTPAAEGLALGPDESQTSALLGSSEARAHGQSTRDAHFAEKG